MSKTIKYTGTQVRWPELAVTGKQSVWSPGDSDERSDADALLLTGTGLFTEVVALSDLSPIALKSMLSGAENPYTKALYFGAALVQAGSVKDFSQNGADAVYYQGITDADVYDTNPGYLTIPGGGSGASKCLYVDQAKAQWDLALGQGLLLQICFDPGSPSTLFAFFGNGNSAAAPGIDIYCHSSVSKDVRMYVRGRNSAANGTLDAAGSNYQRIGNWITGDNCLTLYIDPDTKILNAWLNGKRLTTGTNLDLGALNLGSTTVNASPQAHFGIGGSSGTTPPSTSQLTKIKAFRLAVLPAGARINSPAYVDQLFRVSPQRKLTLADMAV